MTFFSGAMAAGAAAAMLLVSGGVLRKLWPRLGGMRWPVLAYVAALSVMLWLAWGVFLGDRSALVIAAGATCFYFSDLAVALDAFVAKKPRHLFWGLPLYYLGQFLLALSV